MDPISWKKLISAVEEVQEFFPEGLAFIGGIAVYAHAMSSPDTNNLAAFSHDADFVILLQDYADLRDLHVLTPNPRLSKQQFEKSGFEFDVYVEHQNDLCVPTDEIIAFSEMRIGIRVASLEHLVLLKLKAFTDRKGTPKGDKDEDDLLRILYLMKDVQPDLLVRMDSDWLPLLSSVVNGKASLRLCRGNAHQAKTFKNKCQENLDKVFIAFRSVSETNDCSHS